MDSGQVYHVDLYEDGHSERVTVHITDTELTWSALKTGIVETVTLKCRQILVPHITEGADNSIVDVYYVKYVAGDKADVERVKQVVTFVTCHEDCVRLRDSVDKLIRNDGSDRPKRWLIILNAVSGWQTARGVYNRILSPLLTLCGVVAHVVETEYENHAQEILATYDLTSIDAVVAMGGDGTVGQVTTALIMRTMRDANIDINDPAAMFVKPAVRFGVIPAGSVNVISYSLNYTRSLIACTISIILGRCTPTDALTLHQNHKFCRQSNLDVNIGSAVMMGEVIERLRWLRVLRLLRRSILTDALVIRHKEAFLAQCNLIVEYGPGVEPAVIMNNWRWLGLYRFILMFPLLWWYWGYFNAEIEYLEVPEEEKEHRLHPDAMVGRHDWDTSTITPSTTPGWKIYRGRFALANFLNFAMLDFMKVTSSSNYVTPCMTSGKFLLILIKPVNFFSLICELITIFKKGRAYVRECTLDQIEVTQCKITLMSSWCKDKSTYLITQDGDPILLRDDPTLHAKMHSHCFDMFCVDDSMAREALSFSQHP